MLFYCCTNVEDGGTLLKQHWFNVSCLLGNNIAIKMKRKDLSYDDWKLKEPSGILVYIEHFSALRVTSGVMVITGPLKFSGSSRN